MNGEEFEVTLPKTVRGRAWKFGDNIDTDQIIPAKYAIYSLDEKELGNHPLGSGPVIGRGSTLSPRIFELLSETAERLDIPHTVEASGQATRTDADTIQIARAGIPAGLVSIPLRYMHSPVEMVDLADVESVVELVAGFAAALDPELDLTR